MKQKNKRKILVLGEDGMVGRVVATYLRSVPSLEVFSTARDADAQFQFQAQSAVEDLKQIISRIGGVDTVINCIGKLRLYPMSEMVGKESEYILTNSLLPQQLSQLSAILKFKLIHISTDAVFSPQAGEVNEGSMPSAQDVYSASKLLGEPSTKSCLSIRTSFVGFNPKHGAGLIELVRRNSNESISGFTNQIWTGCTALQFSQLVAWLVIGKNFNSVRSESPVIHFSPLGPVSKFEILHEISYLISKKTKVKKAKGEVVNRVLGTNFAKHIQLTSYESNLRIALQALIDFERTQMGKLV